MWSGSRPGRAGSSTALSVHVSHWRRPLVLTRIRQFISRSNTHDGPRPARRGRGGNPHDSFSRASLSTTDRTFRCVAGRPGRPWRDRRDHRRRTMSRCHRKMFPGATISRIPATSAGPCAVAVGCGMLAEPSGSHDAVVDLQNHRVAGDPDCHDGPPNETGGPESQYQTKRQRPQASPDSSASSARVCWAAGVGFPIRLTGPARAPARRARCRWHR